MLALARIVYKVKAKFFWGKYYEALPYTKKATDIKFDEDTTKLIIKSLQQNAIEVKPFHVDVADYKSFLVRAGYNDMPLYQKGGKNKSFTEKSLEHYIASQLLDFSIGDVYIDIANSCSPTPEIYESLFGCRSYRQDLLFSNNPQQNIIGGDAAHMPVEDGFASKMAMHCSFEHFENDADIRFIQEASRVLRPGGKLCIVPLYLFKEYAYKTNPAVYAGTNITFDRDATLYCVRHWFERQGRFYDASHLKSRIIDNMKNLSLTVFHVPNLHEVAPQCYARFVALFTKKK